MEKGKDGRRVYDAAFREQAVRRIESGENVSALSRELAVRRNVLYRWRDRYRREGVAGFEPRPRGTAWWRPGGAAGGKGPATRCRRRAGGRVGEIGGRQAAQISFLERFEQVSALQTPGEPGASGSTRPSAGRSSKKAR